MWRERGSALAACQAFPANVFKERNEMDICDSYDWAAKKVDRYVENRFDPELKSFAEGAGQDILASGLRKGVKSRKEVYRSVGNDPRAKEKRKILDDLWAIKDEVFVTWRKADRLENDRWLSDAAKGCRR